MSKFTTEQLVNAMNNTENIRNISILASVDAGKSTMTDSLLCHAGLINKKDAGDKLMTDGMAQEKERGITIKSVGVSLCIPHNGSDYVINVIDTPGHNNLNHECSAALRLSDGGIIMIDTTDGIMIQTRMVTIQSLRERAKPILIINKIDKLFLSLKMNHDEIYDLFLKNISDLNNIIGMYQDPILSDQRVDPVLCSVCFGSAYHTWGFSLKTFANYYTKKLGKKVLPKHLWRRENFKRLILEPIQFVLNSCESHPEKSVDGKYLKDVVEKIGITLQKSDYELKGKELFRAVMGTWLPIAKEIVDMTIDHVPSPAVAQRYRVDILYNGPTDDIYYKAIKECDPKGPLIVYVSKMIPNKDNSHFYAFGRVFSGTATCSKVKILLNDHNPMCEFEGKSMAGKSRTYLDDSIKRVIIMMASRTESVESISAGNTLALDGIDKTMIKSGTVVGGDHIKCFPLKNIKFVVSPVVRYSIRPKNPSDIAKFVDTLRKFIKSDPGLHYIYNKESGEHILAGSGELHLETALEQLRTDFLKNIEFVVSDPVVQYCETVSDVSDRECLAKSSNKHNRLFATAEPLDEKIVTFMEGSDMPTDHKLRAKYIVNNCDKVDDIRKVWAFTPESSPTNIFINQTSGVQYLNDVEGSINAEFISTCEKGPLCEEPIRGVRFNLKDVKLHADKVHRGDSQIPTKSVMFSSMLSAKPRLLEPVFSLEISVAQEHVSTVYKVLSKRRGSITNVIPDSKNMNVQMEGFLPISESFGFADLLCGETSGTAFVSMMFSHWQVVPGDPLEDGSYANKILLEVRKRKGKKVETPRLEDYLDKL
jgi:elongation factor 2